MKNKIFLTSALCMAFACPAFAANNDEWIETGDTCDNTNLGTYEGTANVEAIWTIDPRTCSAGQSYDSTTNTCITCTAGNYCPGGTFNVNSLTDGLNACPNGYALSAVGAGADTDCYRTCTTSDVAHSETVSGGYYYGDNNQCEATSCANGWHLKSTGVTLPQDTSPTISAFGCMAYPTQPNQNNPQFETTTPQKDQSYYGITGYNQWGVDTGYGIVHGIARCSTTAGVNAWYTGVTGEGDILANITDETGQTGAQHCWCQMTDYKATDASTWQNVSSAWIYNNSRDSADTCATYCSSSCSIGFIGIQGIYDNFRDAMLASLPSSLASCEANNIALKWYNENTEVIPANSAAEQCTYNETITIPTNEPTKTGYTFGGWKLRTNQ